MVTREQILQHFAENGSVLLNGKIISRIEDLPSEFELAEGDAGRQAAILAQEEANLAAQQERVARLRAQVKSGQPEGTKAEKTDKQAELRANLEVLTIDELKAEAEEAKIIIPADVTRKADIIDFLLREQQ